MKKTYIYLMLVVLVAFTSCEKELTTKDITVGEIRFPSIVVTGSSPLVVIQGDTYNDPGAQAFLGEDDITDQMQTVNNVDTNTPGVYSVLYSVTTVNELDQESTVNASRTVIVSSEDISDVDLSGSYQGSGFGSDIVTVTKISNGWYFCDKALASGNNVGVYFAHFGGNNIEIPGSTTRFGTVNTTTPGTFATLTPSGFQWLIFISCCGNFPTVTFEKI